MAILYVEANSMRLVEYSLRMRQACAQKAFTFARIRMMCSAIILPEMEIGSAGWRPMMFPRKRMMIPKEPPSA